MGFRSKFTKIAGAALLAAATSSNALVITSSTSAAALSSILTAGSTGLTVTAATLSGHTGSSGAYTNASGTYGIGDGIVLSTGLVTDYGDGPNTVPNKTTNFGVAATGAQEALLDPITGGSFQHFDVTQLDITFDMDAGFDTVFFNVVFGSEEFMEFVGSTFIDGFGLYLNGVNIAVTGGSPVNINHPDMGFLGGTELDGVLAPGGVPVVTFAGGVGDGSTGNTLTFILADTSDGQLDTTVYLASLGGTPPPPPGGTVPEPTTLLLMGAGLIGMGYTRRNKKA